MGLATGGGQFKETLGYLRQNCTAWGFDYVHGLGVPHLSALTATFRAKVVRQMDEAATVFYREVREKAPRKPGIKDLLWFKMWRLNSGECANPNPVDHKYWEEKGWLQSSYYYSTDINPLQKALSFGIGKIMKIFMRKMYQGY